MTCRDCRLCEGRTQIVLPTPCAPGGILAIGEAPGAQEDAVGEGFVGQAGKTLDNVFAFFGVPRSGYGRANIARCRPPENRKPKPDEVAACLPHLAATIATLRPRVLLLVGGTASDIVVGPGNLLARVEQSRVSAFNDFSLAHPVLREALKPYLADVGGVLCYPMPHTSGLAWNRKAKDGRKWSDIGMQQVQRALAACA